MKKLSRGTIPRIVLIWLASLLIMLSFWMIHTFGPVPLWQAEMLISADLIAGAVPVVLNKLFVGSVIVVPVVVTLVLVVARSLEERGKQFLSLATLSLVSVIAIIFILEFNFLLFDDARHETHTFASNIFDKYSAPPQSLRPPTKKINLIWIFVESLEDQYQDAAINRELEQATEFMTPLNVSPLISRYTIGGVISAKCGTPLVFNPWLVLRTRDVFMSHADCIDDLLRTSGYESYFVVGHDAKLSGLRRYYTRHASSRIYDQEYFKSHGTPKDNDYPTYSDAQVFEEAWRILKSQDLKLPFALNILTLDNHAPGGFPSRACIASYGTSIPDVIRCNNHFLAAFIVRLRREGILKDTVLVVTGDHPFMGTFDQTSYPRGIFARIYTPVDRRKVVNDHPTPFDLFPSVLSAMDFDIGARQYGYGYSIYELPTYPEKDWKLRLEGFASQPVTKAYKSLF
jgi:phosphoglycerol transferase